MNSVGFLMKHNQVNLYVEANNENVMFCSLKKQTSRRLMLY